MPASVLKEMDKIEKSESFMRNLRSLCESEELWTVDMVRGLQRMVIEEILSDEEVDDACAPGGPRSSGFVHVPDSPHSSSSPLASPQRSPSRPHIGKSHSV
jgi:hypothetical protein